MLMTGLFPLSPSWQVVCHEQRLNGCSTTFTHEPSAERWSRVDRSLAQGHNEKMRALIAGTVVAGFVASWAGSSLACGPTETLLSGLLPLPDQADVPLNAVLIATGNHFELEIRLRKISSASDPNLPRDAGMSSVDVAVDTTCLPEANRRLCLGRAELEPDTNYEWQVVATQGGGQEGPWQSFVTLAETAELPAPDIELAVTRNELFEYLICAGPNKRVVDVEFTVRGIRHPVVMTGDIALAYPYGWGRLLDPDAGTTEVNYLSDGDCADLVAYDLLGTAYPLPTLCFDEELPGTYVYQDDTRVPLADLEDGSNSEGDAAVSGESGSESKPTPTRGAKDVNKNRVESESGGGCDIAVGRSGRGGAAFSIGLLALMLVGRQRRRARGRA
jgi:hypothetical protein